jgi:hypothetical protein
MFPMFSGGRMWTTREVRQRQRVIVKQEIASRVIVYPSFGNVASFDSFLRLTYLLVGIYYRICSDLRKDITVWRQGRIHRRARDRATTVRSVSLRCAPAGVRDRNANGSLANG